MSPRKRETFDMAMKRREAGVNDRWIVFRLVGGKWATGPRGLGVYAQVHPHLRKWIVRDTLVEAGDYARSHIRTAQKNRQEPRP